MRVARENLRPEIVVQEVNRLVSARAETEVRGAEEVERSEMLSRRRRVEKSESLDGKTVRRSSVAEVSPYRLH